MLKYKILYTAVLAAAAVMFIIVNTPQSLVLLILFAVLPLLVKLLSKHNANNLSIECSMSDACIAGKDTNPVEFRVVNKGRFPFGSIKIDIIHENRMFKTKSYEIMSLIGGSGDMVFKIPSEAEKCGKNIITIQNVFYTDALRLTKNAIDFKWKKEFIAYPNIPQIHADTEKLIETEFAGRTYDKTRSGNDNSEVFQVRDYNEGDSLHAVHWKLSSKTDDLIVRDWSRPTNFRILVLCDVMINDMKNQKIDYSVISTVFGTAEAVSQNLAMQGIGHQMGIIANGVPVEKEIISSADSEEMLDALMSIVIPDSDNNTMDDLISLGYHEKFSKIIYIAPHNNAENALMLAPYTDITVISVNKDGKDTCTRQDGCYVYSISAENIMKDTHYMVV